MWVVYLQQLTFVIKHMSGVSNCVADALSRRRTLLDVLQVSVPGFASFTELYESDAFFGSVLEDLKYDLSHDYMLHDDFLFRGGRVCAPACSLPLQLILKTHNEGRIGWDCTLHLVSCSYFWPILRRNIERFVERCVVVNNSKVMRLLLEVSNGWADQW